MHKLSTQALALRVPPERTLRAINSPHGPRPWLPATNRPTQLGRMAGFDVGDGTTGGGRP
jgi:hypothetical protein